MFGSFYYFALKAIKDRAWRRKAINQVWRMFNESGLDGLSKVLRGQLKNNYSKWIESHDSLTDHDITRITQDISSFKLKPVISVLMPVFNPPLDYLEQAISSVQQQLYPYWELCIADDASTDAEVRPMLERLAGSDQRIKVCFRPENGHISAASNSALEMVSGEFVALLDNDDTLPVHALYYVVQAINACPNVALMYSDEDKLTEGGARVDPYFKSDWDPLLVLGRNMISHLGVYKTSILREIGGFRLGYEGSQDYDLALRVVEKIDPKQVVHIPKVLYHWRMLQGSTAFSATEKPYALLAGGRAIQDHLNRCDVPAVVETLPSGMYRIRYDLPSVRPIVSLLIGGLKSNADLRGVVERLKRGTRYEHLEFLIVLEDPVASNEITLSLAEEAKIVLVLPGGSKPQTYNAAARLASGELLVFLDATLHPENPEWLEEMVSVALQPGIAAVGAKLTSSQHTIAHAGIILTGDDKLLRPYQGLPESYNGYFGRANLLQCFTCVSGSCLAVRTSTFWQVGGFNEIESIPGYEDLELCQHFVQSGFRNAWTPHAVLRWEGVEKQCWGGACDENREGLFLKRFSALQDPAYNPNLSSDAPGFLPAAKLKN